jgi:hypothetical protein
LRFLISARSLLQVDMLTQGDSLYDIIDKRDHAAVQGQLLHSDLGPSTPPAGQPATSSSEERTFFCRMNVARSFRRQSGFGDHKVSVMLTIRTQY